MKNTAIALIFIISMIGLATISHAGAAKGSGGAVVDCSKGPIPAGPVEVSINGVAFKPAFVKLRRAGGLSSDGVELDKYTLEFMSEDDIFAKLSAEVSFLVPKGKKPDGRTFRRLPDTTPFPKVSNVKQPAAAEGLPEVQGWEMKDRDSGLTISSSFNGPGSLRVELGKRTGKTIPGKIHICVPPGPDAGKKMSSVSGTFEAVLE